MLVATMPGDTEAVVSGRPASRARRCSSAAISTLQSLERAYRRYLHMSCRVPFTQTKPSQRRS